MSALDLLNPETSRRGGRDAPGGLESLEPRLLMHAGDLTISAVSFLQPQRGFAIEAAPGQYVELSATVHNPDRGNVNGSFEVALYATYDGKVVSYDQQVDGFRLSRLGTGESFKHTFGFYAPMTAGTYVYSVVADNLYEIGETNEYNNWGRDVTLTVRAAASAGAVRLLNPATPELVTRGQPYTIYWSGGGWNTTVQLWAYGPNGWNMVADNVAASAGAVQWSTAGLPQGWYCFAAWVNDGGNWYVANSADWLHVRNAYNRAPQITLTTPAVATEVEQGKSFRIRWNSHDADGDAVNVSLWAWSAATGWFQIPGAEWLDGRTGYFDWKTAGVPTGWYSFSAWAYDGSDAVAVGSPNFVRVALPRHLWPDMRFLTPTYGSSVYRGEYFQVVWDVYNPTGRSVSVNLWMYGDGIGWFELGTYNARDGYVYVNTASLRTGWYAFSAWVGNDDLWVSAASDDWLLVI